MFCFCTVLYLQTFPSQIIIIIDQVTWTNTTSTIMVTYYKSNYNETPAENEPEIFIVVSKLQSHIRMTNDRKLQCKVSNLRSQKHCAPSMLTTETQVLWMHQCLRLGVTLVEQEKLVIVSIWSDVRFLLD